jgi:hypothetical protein
MRMIEKKMWRLLTTVNDKRNFFKILFRIKEYIKRTEASIRQPSGTKCY